MTLIDQADGGDDAPAAPTVLVYRKTDRGIVFKCMEQTPRFKRPAGWAATPHELGWTDDQPLLPALPADEPKPRTRKAANHDDSP